MYEGTAGQTYDDYVNDSRYCRAIAEEMVPTPISSSTEQKIRYGSTRDRTMDAVASGGRLAGESIARAIVRGRQTEVFDNCMENRGYRQR